MQQPSDETIHIFQRAHATLGSWAYRLYYPKRDSKYKAIYDGGHKRIKETENQLILQVSEYGHIAITINDSEISIKTQATDNIVDSAAKAIAKALKDKFTTYQVVVI